MRSRNSIMLILAGLIILNTVGCEEYEGPELQKADHLYQTVSDQEGHVYKTIRIGSQVWMAENLRTTKYRDGTPIPVIKSNVGWDSALTGAFCNYENDDLQADHYGSLYNWYAVRDPRGLAPAGWHIPTESEWKILEGFLGGESAAGSKLKETGTLHWHSPNPDALNESGFTALPGGARGEVGQYAFLGTVGFWWSSDLTGNRTAYLRGATNYSSQFLKYTYNKEYGFSVRCLKD